MSDASLTKRLHISGLTPNISQDDLTSRFSSFGTVRALDGLGAVDGNGEPRKFAYLTIDGSKVQLTRCECEITLIGFTLNPNRCKRTEWDYVEGCKAPRRRGEA